MNEFLKTIESIFSLNARILQALLTPLIAIIAVYIAYQQWKTNRDKFRLDMFDKRFKVFDGLLKLYIHINQNGNVSNEALVEFGSVYKEGQFLFDEDIKDLLNQSYKKAFKLHKFDRKIEKKGPALVNNGQKLNDEINCILTWFRDQFMIVETRFDEYLRFK